MNYSQLFKSVRDFFTPRYILFLEHENAQLKAQLGVERLKLENALAPKAPEYVKRERPKVALPQSSWDLYLSEQVKLQDQQAEQAKEN